MDEDRGYDPVPDLAAVMAGLQVPLSINGGRVLGAAKDPLLRLRDGLALHGWPNAGDHEAALRKRLALFYGGGRMVADPGEDDGDDPAEDEDQVQAMVEAIQDAGAPAPRSREDD